LIGGCPHAAIREDISANLNALEELQADYDCEMLFVESGGDNLAANYSRELADYIIYVRVAALISSCMEANWLILQVVSMTG
jgi:Ni2+-binding GTPase involved in maturation of urease and hydrogenase